MLKNFLTCRFFLMVIHYIDKASAYMWAEALLLFIINLYRIKLFREDAYQKVF